MKVVVMAGGRGTRISSVNSEVPKPMIPILDKPIMQYGIECLRRQGYRDFIIVIGYRGEVVKEYFGNGDKFDIKISYIEEKKPLGTAGALYLLKDIIKDDFLLLNGDIIFDVNIHKFTENHKKMGAVATIFTHPNNHPYDSGIIITDEKNMVLRWLHKEDKRKWYQNQVNAGLHMFTPQIFEKFTELKKVDLDRDILKPLIEEGELYAYDSPEYVKDMGTPDRYYAVIEDIKTGKIEARNLSRRQKAVFLDRDGVVNKYVGFLTDINDFELIGGVEEAIKLINQSGYLAIVVTNQPVIARGEVSLEELQQIHNKMETLLGEKGAYLDDVFYCPHHPHKGFVGERSEYKIQCECRKPNPGMLFQAAEKYNIELSSSWMVGDNESDMQAGEAAGCKVAFIGQSKHRKAWESLADFVRQEIENV